MGKPVGGDCDLVLANGRPTEAASDLVLANHRTADSPIGNSRRVSGPCANFGVSSSRGKHANPAANDAFHQIKHSWNASCVILYEWALRWENKTRRECYIFSYLTDKTRCGWERTPCPSCHFSFSLCQWSSLLFWPDSLNDSVREDARGGVRSRSIQGGD